MLHRNACSGELARNNAFWAHAGYRVDLDEHGVGSVRGQNEVGAHKTSMLQDLERGRPMEIDALIGSVQELGRITDTPTPTIDTVLALVALRGRVSGLYH